MGFTTFIIQDDKKIINKLLFGIEKCNRKDNTISLISLRFSTQNYNNLTKCEIESSSKTAIELFHLINEFGKIHKIKEGVTLYMLDDRMQQPETDTGEIFQLYFYEIFEPLTESKIINNR